MRSQVLTIELTFEERDFLMRLMISRPPAESEDGIIEGNDAIKEMPAAEYRRLWVSVDDKLRAV
jgi:hypothetical protein